MATSRQISFGDTTAGYVVRNPFFTGRRQPGLNGYREQSNAPKSSPSQLCRVRSIA
jgi:hypothetical protein